MLRLYNPLQGIEEQKNDEEPFDLGPLWALNGDLTLDDFKHCVIDEKSIDYLITAINRNELQRFVIYGKLKKIEDKPSSVFYVFFQPSVSSTEKKEHIQKLEESYGTDCVVQARINLQGIVHIKTKKIRIKEAKSDSDFMDFLKNSTPEYEVGLSCIFNLNDENQHLFSLINRSTMNFSTSELNEVAKCIWIFPTMTYDASKREFYERKASLSLRLDRTAMIEIEQIVINAMNIAINKRLTSLKDTTLIPKLSWVTRDKDATETKTYINFWDDNVRYNKENFISSLEYTIYVAACLRPGEKTSAWTNLTDDEIIIKTLELANNYNVRLDLNKTYFPNQHIRVNEKKILFDEEVDTGYTLLMGLAKKGPLNLIKKLIAEHGVNFIKKDIYGRDALFYAREYKQSAIVTYLESKKLSHYVALSECKNTQQILDQMDQKDKDAALSNTIDIFDPLGKKFISVTLLQYALWADNGDMCKLLLSYMSESEARLQITDLEKNGITYQEKPSISSIRNEKNFNFQILKKELNSYVKNDPATHKKQQLPSHLFDKTKTSIAKNTQSFPIKKISNLNPKAAVFVPQQKKRV